MTVLLDWLPLLVVLLLFAAGVLLTILPVFPGPLLVFLGIAVHELWVPELPPGRGFLVLALVLVAGVLLVDYLLALLGARRYGASWWGALGALLGGIVGLFLPPPLLWVFLGPGIGAVLAEILSGRPLGEAGRAGWGSFLGLVLGLGLKLAVCFFLILAFLSFRFFGHGA
jgi:uncharacterized protein YqgC (DUF456 family)